MQKVTAFTGLIHELSYLLDKGISFSFEEVYTQIENKAFIDWLEEQFPWGSEIGIDFSNYKEKQRAYVHDELLKWYEGYVGSEKRKWGIENNGLCVVLSWCSQIVKSLYDERQVLEGDWIE